MPNCKKYLAAVSCIVLWYALEDMNEFKFGGTIYFPLIPCVTTLQMSTVLFVGVRALVIL